MTLNCTNNSSVFVSFKVTSWRFSCMVVFPGYRYAHMSTQIYKLLPYKDSLMSVKHKTTAAAHNMYLHMQLASQFHLELDPVVFEGTPHI